MTGPIRRTLQCAFALLLAAAAAGAHALDAIVQKQVFQMPSYTTQSGQTIRNVRFGYETYGTLNAARDNVILVTHFFSGSSHAAGKYKPEDAAPGYWDAIIGPGRPIDTDRYFVVATDTLVNLNAKDPNVVTTGPATVNPDTGRPYGLSFPVVSMRDFVNVQKALLDSLGIKRLQAVVGASGGAIQAVEWSAAYPEMVERVVAVIGPGLEIDPYMVSMLSTWALPITMDPKWANGDYYGKDEPVEGLAQALRIVTLTASGNAALDKRYGRKPAAAEKDPGRAMGNAFLIDDALYKAGLARAKTVDANNYLYMVRANQLFSVTDQLGKMKSKFLFVPAKSDLIFPPWMSHKAAATLRANGNAAEVFEIEGEGGHYDGIFQIAKAAKPIADFLAR